MWYILLIFLIVLILSVSVVPFYFKHNFDSLFDKTNFPSHLSQLFINNVVCLLNDKEKHSKVWSKDLVYEKTFRLSRHTPRIQFNVLSRTIPPMDALVFPDLKHIGKEMLTLAEGPNLNQSERLSFNTFLFVGIIIWQSLNLTVLTFKNEIVVILDCFFLIYICVQDI